MTKFSNKLKKLCFWPIFPTFGQKKFPENLALPHTTSYVFLVPCQNLEKKQSYNSKKISGQTEEQTERWTKEWSNPFS